MDIHVIQNQVIYLQTQVGQLLNTSDDAAWEIDDIHNTIDTQTETSYNNLRDTSKVLETTKNQ